MVVTFSTTKIEHQLQIIDTFGTYGMIENFWLRLNTKFQYLNTKRPFQILFKSKQNYAKSK